MTSERSRTAELCRLQRCLPISSYVRFRFRNKRATLLNANVQCTATQAIDRVDRDWRPRLHRIASLHPSIRRRPWGENDGSTPRRKSTVPKKPSIRKLPMKSRKRGICAQKVFVSINLSQILNRWLASLRWTHKVHRCLREEDMLVDWISVPSSSGNPKVPTTSYTPRWSRASNNGSCNHSTVCGLPLKSRKRGPNSWVVVGRCLALCGAVVLTLQ